LDSFCHEPDLLSLNSHELRNDAIENEFFGEIDTKGASARDALMSNGPRGLDIDKRCDFARLLLSLEARWPVNVHRLRTEGRGYLANELDSDSEILRVMNEAGIAANPSEYVETQLGWSLEDRAVASIQELVDNPEVGKRLINAHWAVKRITQREGSLVLSDRPLIRIHGYNRPGATWVLPLDPYAAFIACNDPKNLTKLTKLSGQRFVKETNRSSVNQAERFVFCADQSHEDWVGKYLKPSS